MNYKTLKKNSVCEFVEKRSRFIARAYHVTNEDEALSVLNEIRTTCWDASHNVFAYIIRKNNIARFSDDGEPSKTAGPPVMDVLSLGGLCDCLVVVTRYFGGTLLGVGGLVKAYGSSAKMAVDAAGIAVMTLCCRYGCRLPYSDWGKFQNVVKGIGATLEKNEFTDVIETEICISKEMSDKLISEITEQFNDTIKPEFINEEYVDLGEQ